MSTLAFKSATEQAALIAAGDVSARELLDASVSQYELWNSRINAVVVERIEIARQRAHAADQAHIRGESWGPLHGIPSTIKDVIDWVEAPSTWGDPALAGHVPRRNAAALDGLFRAGAIVWGKTNVPYMLYEWQSHNALYGRTNNPWDQERTPGGSSGGSAASIATGMAALEIGSDIGGSIRFPASYCGVFGHRPTFGIIPQAGHELPGRESPVELNTVGPLARSAGDLQLVMSTGILAPRARLVSCLKTRPEQFRVAIMLDNPIGSQDDALTSVLRAAIDALGEAGVHLDWQARPALDLVESFRMYEALHLADRDGLHIETKQPIRYEDWVEFKNHQQRDMRIWADFFAQGYDAFLCPVSASAATPHDTETPFEERKISVNGVPVSTLEQWFWAGFSAGVGLPSCSVPVGFTPSGLPVGLQVVAADHADPTALAFAAMVERTLGGFVAPSFEA